MSATMPSLDLDERIARIRRQQLALNSFVPGPDTGSVVNDPGLIPALLLACCTVLAGLGLLLLFAY